MKLDDLPSAEHAPIVLSGLTRRFGERVVLDGLNLTKAQKAALWAAMGTSWKEENNPYK